MFNPHSPCESFQTVVTGVSGHHSLLRETSDGVWVAVSYHQMLEVASALCHTLITRDYQCEPRICDAVECLLRT